MLLGIDGDGWEQLWSGFFGSLIAAVVGGVVALLVVRLTNRQARRNAADERLVNAIAEVGALVTSFSMLNSLENFDPRQEFIALDAAFIKVRLASPDNPELNASIESLPALMTGLAIEFHLPHTSESNKVEIREFLGTTASALVICLCDWPSDPPKAREASLTILNKCVRDAEEMSAALDRGEDVIDRSDEDLPRESSSVGRIARAGRKLTEWIQK